MTLSQTMQLFHADILRRVALENKKATAWQLFFTFFKRGVMVIFIYRLKRYFYLKNNMLARITAWLLRMPEFYYCHSELDPRAQIGEGLVLSDEGGIGISFYNVIGKNCTFLGKATPTLGAMEDVNFETDRIRIGDHCVIGPNVRIVNPVTLAEGTQIKANSVIMSSFNKPGCIVSGFPAKEIASIPLPALLKWSPLISQPIQT